MTYLEVIILGLRTIQGYGHQSFI